LDPEKLYELRSFVIQGENGNGLIEDYSFDRVSGGNIGFHSKMMITQGNFGQITMAYRDCDADVESVI